MIFTRASLLDLTDLLTARGLTVPAARYRALVVQVLGCEAWCARRQAGTAPVAIGGVFRFGDRPGEAWLLAQAEGLGGDLLGVAFRARRHLREHGGGAPGLIARVQVGNAEGERLARCLGFELAEVACDAEIWRYGDGRSGGRSVRRRRGEEDAAPDGSAAGRANGTPVGDRRRSESAA